MSNAFQEFRTMLERLLIHDEFQMSAAARIEIDERLRIN